jgi:CRP-like cAMP-binding protein
LARAASALPVSRLFDKVPDDITQQVLGSGQALSLKAGHHLFDRGDASGTMYVVKSGRIEISLVTEAGRKMVFNQIGPGHCIGEIGMIDEQLRTASAIALEPSSVIPIARATFFTTVQRCPQLAINLMEILCERMRWVNDSVEEYALHSLHLRLARRLLVLHNNFKGTDGAITIAQSDLADFAGATRESINKILIQWKSEGLIDLGRRKIKVLSVPKLEQIAYRDLEPS